MLNLSLPLPSSAYAIILNGHSEAITRLKKYWKNYQKIIICDGAWIKVSQLFADVIDEYVLKEKVIIIGDGDSLPNEFKPEQFIHDTDQHSTDFEKALSKLLDSVLTTKVEETLQREPSTTEVDIYWGNGGELDHTLGNMTLASKYAKTFTCHFFTNTQYYRFINKIETDQNLVTIENAKNQVLSIIPFPRCVISQTEGLLYSMSDYVMQLNTQQSLRNTIIEERAHIMGHGEYFLFVGIK